MASDYEGRATRGYARARQVTYATVSPKASGRARCEAGDGLRLPGPRGPGERPGAGAHNVTSIASIASAIDSRQTSVNSGRSAQSAGAEPAGAATGTRRAPARRTYTE